MNRARLAHANAPTRLLKAFPGAEAYVFSKPGHNPNGEQPQAVALRIDAFLRNHP
jgi:pimeloyl-ACP methyl ester carboxylesterase